MRERAIKVGRTTPLAGVLAEPNQPAVAAGRPAILILNSGILHHAGASRLHVQLARALADEGYFVLRFDFSGIGDSEARRDTLSFAESAVAETREAMDWLAEKKGATSFVLAGLCSGADMAFNVSLVDPRVTGVIQLDAYAYRTRGYWIRHYGPRLLSPAAWAGLVRRKLAALRPKAAAVAPATPEERDADNTAVIEYRRRFPPRDQVAEQLRALVQRQVRLWFVFSGGQEEHINHAAQYKAAFPDVNFGDRARVDYVATADHLFTRLDDQRWLVRECGAWMRAYWPERPAAAVDASRDVTLAAATSVR